MPAPDRADDDVPISTRVNKPENDEPSLLDRVGDRFDVWAAFSSEGRA